MTPIDMYEELYVTGVRYATKAERKAAMKDKLPSRLLFRLMFRRSASRLKRP